MDFKIIENGVVIEEKWFPCLCTEAHVRYNQQ